MIHTNVETRRTGEWLRQGKQQQPKQLGVFHPAIESYVLHHIRVVMPYLCSSEDSLACDLKLSC